ncbi:MAG: chitobiase/beta-hexosaminidase C-terminal domain-containing protein, partial [Muribaculaceae bacterium]|nr:chitobiase/beta-hexosaminidase C-terminal domain-containing protein [Muribaculaceae bacterium]
MAVTAGSTTLMAKAVRSDGKESATATAFYTIVPATPTFTPAGDQYTDAQNVTLACATTGAAIKYSTDGGTTWLDYTTPVAVTAASTTITAKAVRDGQESTAATATYQVVPAAPTLSQGSSLFADPFTLTITRGAGATSMVYTVNGTSTTTTEATVSLTIAETTTVTAHGVNDASTQSPEVEATYTYSTLAGNKYKLVTSASELVAGKHYVIVCRLSDPNYAMSGSGHDPTFAVGSNYYRSYSQGFSYADASTRDEIVVTDLSTVLTLAGSEGKWQWHVSNATDMGNNPIEGYLQADATASSHYMYVYDTDNNNYNEANTLTTVTFPKDGITYNSTKTEPAGVQITFNVSPKDDKGRDKF